MTPRPHSDIAPGGDLKFRVTPHIDDFLISEDPFQIIIKNQTGRVCYRIPRGHCFYDSEGRWYFGLEHVQEGLYEAIFCAKVEDDDYDKQRCVVTDRRLLIAVGRYALPPEPTEEPQKPWVEYEQVWTVSVDGADYLADKDGRYILTADGQRIQFNNAISDKIGNMGKVKLDTMTGEQFKQLVEGKNPNGEIDTLPEGSVGSREIEDGGVQMEDLAPEVRAKLNPADNEQYSENSDVDEMFLEQASTQPTVPTQPLVVEEEEEP